MEPTSQLELSDCVLCPHACHVDRLIGRLGICKAGPSMKVSRAALHFWEEPPISGTAGSGTVFFSNCNLHCVYCQNHRISKGDAGKTASIDEVAEMCLDLQAQGAMNINLVTPTHYAPLIRDAITLARERGLSLPIVWNTSGYETVDAISKNTGYVDIYLTDFKYFDDSLAKRFSGVNDYCDRAIQAIDEMLKRTGRPQFDDFYGNKRLIKGVVVRHMLIPGHLDDSEKVLKVLQERYGRSILVSIMNQYTPVLTSLANEGDAFAIETLKQHPELGMTVSNNEYEKLLDFADNIEMQDYFWQDGETCKESFIPDFGIDNSMHVS